MLIVSDKEGLTNGDPSKVTAEDKEEDPHRRFLANSEHQVTKAYAEEVRRPDALVPQGYMIRATLETAIQSDLAGMVRAITTEDVYSFDGRRVLLPKGTMLTGEYKSGLAYGQTRVFVVWTRMLRADGVSLMLQSPGTDALGRSGLTGEVDTHFLQRFGSATLLTLAGGAAQFASALGQNYNQYQGQQFVLDPASGTLIPLNAVSQGQILLNARQIGAQTVAQSVTRMAQEALRNDIKVPPTVHIDQGTPVIVFVKRDLDFSDLYPDPVKEALYELRHPKKATGGRGCDTVAMGDAAGLLPAGCAPDSALVRRY
jgi:type IV secretion system protein VirB10